jgi:allantoin racemase
LKVSAEEAIDAFWEYKKSGTCGSIIQDMADESVAAIEQDDASVITIGCGGLMWTVDLLQEELGKRGYDIPCVNPVPAAIEIAKIAVKLKLKQSRILYPRHSHPYMF